MIRTTTSNGEHHHAARGRDERAQRRLLNALRAVARGNFAVRLPADDPSIDGEIASAFNEVVELNQRVGKEVERVATGVGRDGRIAQRASIGALSGSWAMYVDALNSLIDDLSQPIAEVSRVIGSVAKGDLSQRMALDIAGRPVKGEFLRSSKIVNKMVDQLSGFAVEVTRVAREVGSEGKLGGQARVRAVAGTWKDLTDSVNWMARNLTNQVRNIAEVTTAVALGDLSKKITVEASGEILQLKDTINTMVDQLNAFASEVTRVAREVGSEGKLGGQAQVQGVAGTWKDLTDSVNSMAGNLTNQVRNIAAVTTAVANGDLSKKITVDVRGEILELKDTINTMVDQLNAFASEVTRVAREVGSEGKLGGQAQVQGVAGTWKDLTDSVNSMAGNLTNQVRNIADVTTAVARGDLSRKITVDARGEILELKGTINTMVDQLNAFASEVTRVAREVGSEGRLGGQAQVEGVGGTWKDLTDSVNSMAGNLTNQVRNIAEVTTAVARGDLSKKITVDVRGEILELKGTINTMVDQLNGFASEVTRVAREVGSEGNLGGQAEVKGAAGTWRDLVDSVNSMARNLTNQVRNIATVTTAVANGDLSKKITVAVRGEILELKDTINTMVDQLNAFASEVTRVAREVGSEGKLGGQAQVQGVAGTWKDLTDSVNSMAGNLTSQVRNIADVTTAVAKGDLSRKITVDARGEILELKGTINTMVDQLNAFASEVTRVAREVGSEGKLGGQAQVQGVGGTWKDLTDSVNSMAGNLTSQVRNIAEVTTAVAKGDLSKKIAVDVRGEMLELKGTINTMVDQLNGFASEVTRVAREVGSEGKLGGQAQVQGVGGTWKDLTDSVNSMAGNLTSQVRNIAKVTTAVANGDLSKKITVDVQGEILELKDTINTMVDQLNAFASEVTRVAREVGSEGKLGGQAIVPGVGGTWKDLTDSVNLMAGNLTEQVRGIAKVVTGVANGDLKRKLTLEAKGEIAALADTINGMIDTLATFADQVTTVAREVGFEGKLGGQALVPGAAGLWRDLTDNVNQLAANLTSQVRAIGEVATAVTKGDLSRTIEVEARGEVEALTENVNKMIWNLRDTTQKNNEQDWLKTNLARFTGMLQGQRDLQTVGRLIMSELAPLVSAQKGIFYMRDSTSPGEHGLTLLAGYAVDELEAARPAFRLGESLVGAAAQEKRSIVITDAPDGYLVRSGLGGGKPVNIAVLPVLFEDEVMAVIELASFDRFNSVHLLFLDQLRESIGVVLNTISANMRTEELLKQSQSLTRELQIQQEELQETNEELEEKARLLSERNQEIERRTREIDQARNALEQKAEQLALTSKYKSQFLANMSHELRTPLNSLLILSKQLAQNPDGNLSGKQVDFASTIHAAGTDLLTLISDILDLSKIESGTTTVDIGEVRTADIGGYTERTFRQVASGKGLEFLIDVEPDVPTVFRSDATRLQQILKNLLSNAFKFTEAGKVELHVSLEDDPTSGGGRMIAFAVSDSGIGIPSDKLRVIFEAFQQADMTTARKYGGTGLGLSISREIAQLLGGKISVVSTPGVGSKFTFYHPLVAREQTDPRSEAQLTPESKLPRVEPWFTPTLRPAVEAARVTGDDREGLRSFDRVLLIVEDDPTFARIVLDIARDRGFKGVLAFSAQSALEWMEMRLPDAITIDIKLPDMDGWELVERMRSDPRTASIPVHVVSGEEHRNHEMAGLVTQLQKPVTVEALQLSLDKLFGFVDRGQKDVLVVEDDLTQLNAMTELIGKGEVRVTAVQTAAEAIEALTTADFHCFVADLGLPDMDGADLLRRVRDGGRNATIPIIVYTGRELTKEEDTAIAYLAETVIVKDAKAPERLVDELSLFLHQVNTRLPSDKRMAPDGGRDVTRGLDGKKVLVVDDDVRNILALTSALESCKLNVLYAETGQAGIEQLEKTPDVDAVLMDIMMPEMDGFETMRRIRAKPEFASLPIIALTAKAMKADRETCIEAGASDYISKPVDIDQLVSLLRVWLCR
ncbi:MAG TPA: HAMP domain-containing protein [Candidatus Eremiobacteraceae bacterium]